MQVQAATVISTATTLASADARQACLVFLNPEPLHGGGCCGYFDSSFELSHGLQVTEESDPTLLQLWAQALNSTLTRH